MLNGTSSAGKSSLARGLQAILPAPWLTLGIDDLIHALPLGLDGADAGIVIDTAGVVHVGTAFRTLEAAWYQGLAAIATGRRRGRRRRGLPRRRRLAGPAARRARRARRALGRRALRSRHPRRPRSAASRPGAGVGGASGGHRARRRAVRPRGRHDAPPGRRRWPDDRRRPAPPADGRAWKNPTMSEQEAICAGEAYLALIDRLLPGRITGFYVVGSAALGAYHLGRSDLDFVARRRRPPRRGRAAPGPRRAPTERRQHRRRRDPARPLTTVGYLQRDLPRRRRPHAPGRPDRTAGVPHRSRVLPSAPGASTPISARWPGRCSPSTASLLRGPAASALGLDGEPDRLASWNRQNLEDYCAPVGRTGREAAVRFVRAPSPLVDLLGHARCPPAARHDRHGSRDLQGGRGRVRPRDVRCSVARPHRRHALAYRRRRRGVGHLSVAHRARSTSAFVLDVIDCGRDARRPACRRLTPPAACVW